MHTNAHKELHLNHTILRNISILDIFHRVEYIDTKLPRYRGKGIDIA